jgi:phenolic acid decarboxylase
MRALVLNVLLSIACLGNAAASARGDAQLAGRSFVFRYEDGAAYRVTFDDDASRVTWAGLQGPDQGRSETDAYRSQRLSDGIHFVHWTENDGTFVSLALNLKAMTLVSAGKAGDATWFKRGAITRSAR